MLKDKLAKNPFQGFSFSKVRLPFKKRWQKLLFIFVLLILIAGLVIILKVEENYMVLKETDKDVAGTQYEQYGNRLLKYSPDGVSCLDSSGNVLWNNTFSMSSPIVDICGSTAAVGDQQGTDIYIFDQSGQIGHFETLLPIEKIKVASQGVVAAVLEDGDVTWINFYDTNGNLIAENRTTIDESGYPLDIALSSDGLKMMVSFLCATSGEMYTNVVFYNFDSIGQAEINNLVSEGTYSGAIVPEVDFLAKDSAVALRSDGFSIYRGREIPEETANVEFDKEILSTFHDNDHIGFIFKSDREGYDYELCVYGLNGRRTVRKYFNFDYKQVKMERGNIILFNDKEFLVYSDAGRRKVSIAYQKSIQNVIPLGGLGTYLIVTGENTELIRVI